MTVADDKVFGVADERAFRVPMVRIDIEFATFFLHLVNLRNGGAVPIKRVENLVELVAFRIVRHDESGSVAFRIFQR